MAQLKSTLRFQVVSPPGEYCHGTSWLRVFLLEIKVYRQLAYSKQSLAVVAARPYSYIPVASTEAFSLFFETDASTFFHDSHPLFLC